MKLPALNLPFLNKKPSEEYLISLIFNPKNVIAILLSKKESSINIVSTKNVSLDLSSATIEDMISAADEAISSIELSTDEGTTLEKTIFSVPYSWGDEEGNIKEERLLQLKKLSVELALKPMGFIITIEALIKYFQDKETAPLNAIFVEESKDNVYLYLVKKGEILEMQSGEVEGEVEDAVEKTLKKVENLEKLPPRMILLYHEDIESRQQKFIKHPWTKDLPFMHLPQISLMEKGFENEAIVDAIASQLNSNVGDKAEVAGAEVMENEGSSMAEESESFGFLKEQDIADIKEEYSGEIKEPVINVKKDGKDEEMANDENLAEEEASSSSSNRSGGILSLIFSLPNKIMSLVGGFFGRTGLRTKSLLVPILAVVIFVAFMAIYYLLFLRAEVVVFLAGDRLDDEVLVTLSENEETSFEDKILHINTIEQEVEGSVSKETTGVEEIGENATGEVTILSSLEEDQTIESGTVLTSSNGLNFTLNEEVNIASSSGVSDIQSATGEVTAEEFGEEYNLPSGTNFSVEGYDSSSLEAENEVAFSGGTSEENLVVAEEDITALEEQLVDELFEDAIESAEQELSSDEQIISVLLDSSVESSNYSASAGDEASSVSLEGQVVYTLGVYSKEESENFVEDAREGDVPEEFVISEEDSEITLNEVEESSNGITGQLSYEVLYKPDVELDNLSEEIAGKGVDDATQIIEEKEGVSDVSIIFSNKLPLLPSILPMRGEQIIVELQSEGE